MPQTKGDLWKHNNSCLRGSFHKKFRIRFPSALLKKQPEEAVKGPASGTLSYDEQMAIYPPG